jgi:hypothetical protein
MGSGGIEVKLPFIRSYFVEMIQLSGIEDYRRSFPPATHDANGNMASDSSTGNLPAKKRGELPTGFGAHASL